MCRSFDSTNPSLASLRSAWSSWPSSGDIPDRPTAIPFLVGSYTDSCRFHLRYPAFSTSHLRASLVPSAVASFFSWVSAA